MKRLALLMTMVLLLGGCTAESEPVRRPVVELGTANGCDATLQRCLLSHEQLSMQIVLGKSVRTLQPFQLQLQLDGPQASSIEEVEAEFFMEGMEMGVNRYRLIRGEAGWHGVITLPVCVAGRSDWRVVVEVLTAEKRVRGAFLFHSSG